MFNLEKINLGNLNLAETPTSSTTVLRLTDRDAGGIKVFEYVSEDVLFDENREVGDEQ